jgi:hypothetical protein
MTEITSILYNNPKKIPNLSLNFETSFGCTNKVEEIFKSYSTLLKNYDIYEFGTYLGQSLCGVLTYMEDNDVELHRYIGFDSFEGLPDEIMDINNNPFWVKGRYSINNYLKKDLDIYDYKNFLHESNRLPIRYFDKFEVIKGFYSDTLNKETINNHKLRPALFINIDCDLYTSTIEVLDFIFRNKLFVPNKTIIRYDDWANNNMEYLTGQSKAHSEMTKKYGVETELLLKHSHKNDPECTWWLIK